MAPSSAKVLAENASATVRLCCWYTSSCPISSGLRIYGGRMQTTVQSGFRCVQAATSAELSMLWLHPKYHLAQKRSLTTSALRHALYAGTLAHVRIRAVRGAEGDSFKTDCTTELGACFLRRECSVNMNHCMHLVHPLSTRSNALTDNISAAIRCRCWHTISCLVFRGSHGMLAERSSEHLDHNSPADNPFLKGAVDAATLAGVPVSAFRGWGAEVLHLSTIKTS